MLCLFGFSLLFCFFFFFDSKNLTAQLSKSKGLALFAVLKSERQITRQLVSHRVQVVLSVNELGFALAKQKTNIRERNSRKLSNLALTRATFDSWEPLKLCARCAAVRTNWTNNSESCCCCFFVCSLPLVMLILLALTGAK